MNSRWPRTEKKHLVEQCTVLDVNKLAHDGILTPGNSGTLRWGDWCDPSRTRCPFRVSSKWSSPSIALEYTLVDDEGSEEDIVCQISLESSVPNYGGLRWWMRCPVCNKRVVKLYMPPKMHHKVFACRECHDLTYFSTRAKSPKTLFGKLLIQHIIDNL